MFLSYLLFYFFFVYSLLSLLINLSDLSAYLTLLTSLIIPLTLLTTSSNYLLRIINILGIILFVAFSTSNFFLFYISFEIIVIPMIFIIAKGSSSLLSRYRALYRFTLYTILGGLFLLLGLIILLILLGSCNYYLFIFNNSLSYNIQLFLFPIFSIAYLIKLPIIPFHIWLPDTHGEAPTSGSIILAALLLKLGGIGFIRWLIPILPYGYFYYRPLFYILGILSSVYASLTTLRHIDAKKLIAYSSIAHMSVILIGLISLNNLGLKSTLYLLVSHGFISTLLFFLIGSLYIRTGTRIILYYRGLVNLMPLFSIFFFIALILNASIPPSLAYWSELGILTSIFVYEPLGVLNLLLSLFLSGAYSILLFSKMSYSIPFLNNYKDIYLREFIINSLLTFFSFCILFYF